MPIKELRITRPSGEIIQHSVRYAGYNNLRVPELLLALISPEDPQYHTYLSMPIGESGIHSSIGKYVLTIGRDYQFIYPNSGRFSFTLIEVQSGNPRLIIEGINLNLPPRRRF